MENTMYGYIRVSTKEQNEDRQVVAMQEYGVEERCMVIDKQSGKDFDRPGYKRLVKKIKPGDTLVIKSIDTRSRKAARDFAHLVQELDTERQSLTNNERAFWAVVRMLEKAEVIFHEYIDKRGYGVV